MSDTDTLRTAGVQAQGLLEVLPRLAGGGGDGGSTGAESRSAYLAMYAGKKYDKVDPEEERLAKWTACQLSGMPLQPPCVCDELGNLFNKDAVIHALIEKNMPKSLLHITSLKHVIDIKLEPARDAATGAAVLFACPVMGVPMSGKSRFVVVRRGGQGAGVVVSERALKELPEVVKEVAGGEWAAEDVLPLNPVGEELEALKEAAVARREAERAEKKAKKAAKAGNGGTKRQAAAVASGAGAQSGDGPGSGIDGGVPPQKKSKAAELMPANATPEVWNSLFTSSKKEPKIKGNDYMVRGGMKYVA